MSRISNEIVWAVVASVVCGTLVASLLGGTSLPLLVIVVAVAAGLVLTAARRRRERHAYGQPSPPRPPRRSRKQRPPVENEKRPRAGKPETEPPGERTRPAVPEPLPARALVDPSARRIGARAQSLGAQPPTERSDPPR